MATLLIKKKTVLRRTDQTPDGALCFEQELEIGDDMPRPIRSLFLSPELAADMGNPHVVTVTIELGDTLNP